MIVPNGKLPEVYAREVIGDPHLVGHELVFVLDDAARPRNFTFGVLAVNPSWLVLEPTGMLNDPEVFHGAWSDAWKTRLKALKHTYEHYQTLVVKFNRVTNLLERLAHAADDSDEAV